MSARVPPANVGCIDWGATETRGINLLGGTSSPCGRDRVPFRRSTARAREVGLGQLFKVTDRLVLDGAQVLSFGAAARLDKHTNRTIVSAGNLPEWEGTPLANILEARYEGRVPVIMANDGVMILAAELLFGALKDEYFGKDILLIAPGSGVAVAYAIFNPKTGLYELRATEGSHITVDMLGYGDYGLDAQDAHCGCGKTRCVESLASGRRLELAAKEWGVSVQEISDMEVNSLLAPPLGALVRNFSDIIDPDVVLMSGGITFKRPLLKDAVAEQVEHELRRPLPVVKGDLPDAGLLGCSAYWKLTAGAVSLVA